MVTTDGIFQSTLLGCGQLPVRASVPYTLHPPTGQEKYLERTLCSLSRTSLFDIYSRELLV